MALDAIIREQRRPWQVRPINIMEVLDPKDVFRKTMGMEWEDLYNTRLARGWSLGLAQELKFLQALIRLCHPASPAGCAATGAAPSPTWSSRSSPTSTAPCTKRSPAPGPAPPSSPS